MSHFSLSNRSDGTAILIGIVLFTIFSTITVFLIETLVPRSKIVRGVEQGNKAYYNGESGIERTLAQLQKSLPEGEPSSVSGTFTTAGYSARSQARVATIPSPGTGNSGFNKDKNIVTNGKPIEILVGSGEVNFFQNFQIAVNIPDLSSDTEALAGADTDDMIAWVFSMQKSDGTTVSLSSSGEVDRISRLNINRGEFVTSWASKNGLREDGVTPENLNSFFVDANGRSNCSGNRCILKLSLIRGLPLTNGEVAPYLEYQARYGGTATNPFVAPFTVVTSEGYSQAYRQTITKSIPHETALEIVDYANVQ